MKNNILKTIFIINTSFLILSFSIAFVILFRPFYYLHINGLKLEEKTGYSYSEIKEAYDDVIDYCVFNHPFKTGILKYSNDGYDHFKDCQKLFIIDFIILGISLIIFIIKKFFFNKLKIKDHSLEYYSSCILIGLFISLLLSTITIGFNKMFIMFHNIFFIGKNNWILDPRKDQIVSVLPEQFFMNCGIFIIILIIVISISFIIFDYRKRNV